MSQIQKLLEHLNEKFPVISMTTGTELYSEIEEYKKEEDAKYQKLKQEGKITFGRYKGYSVTEMTRTSKGKDYLRWLLQQGWFTEKFVDLVEAIEKEGIKKKNTK
jgi:uncharacterized protein (DUF3820 family)